MRLQPGQGHFKDAQGQFIDARIPDYTSSVQHHQGRKMTHHEADPSTGAGNQFAQHPRPLPVPTGGPGTVYPPNDYSRTWQMQRHHMTSQNHPSHRCEYVSSREDLTNETPAYGISQIDGRPIAQEHIYEIPPFERNCNSLDSPRHKTGSERGNEAAHSKRQTKTKQQLPGVRISQKDQIVML